jgi:hypothetical protein
MGLTGFTASLPSLMDWPGSRKCKEMYEEHVRFIPAEIEHMYRILMA